MTETDEGVQDALAIGENLTIQSDEEKASKKKKDVGGVNPFQLSGEENTNPGGSSSLSSCEPMGIGNWWSPLTPDGSQVSISRNLYHVQRDLNYDVSAPSTSTVPGGISSFISLTGSASSSGFTSENRATAELKRTPDSRPTTELEINPGNGSSVPEDYPMDFQSNSGSCSNPNLPSCSKRGSGNIPSVPKEHFSNQESSSSSDSTVVLQPASRRDPISELKSVSGSEFNSESESTSGYTTELESASEEYSRVNKSRRNLRDVLGSTSRADSIYLLRSAYRNHSDSDSSRESTIERSLRKSNRKFTYKSSRPPKK
ncbi:hypothetical protein NPIL_25591 [Nephila pilipes]|uniref:Uncharacterized protein n=1 Tax=Nephila pilipes TaxID=299642 RepID=A0A8X6PWB5_NEPPI|nr:hypothetical protein NPIL_498801 [Nephila pilipes]GFT86732.1 hypothetical protein NPIL_25591 [Nephila pilipes]